jgi:hypothetical protein
MVAEAMKRTGVTEDMIPKTGVAPE